MCGLEYSFSPDDEVEGWASWEGIKSGAGFEVGSVLVVSVDIWLVEYMGVAARVGA